MIAVDTNVLVYAHRREPAFHDAARRAVKGLAEGNQLWGVPWPCVHEFIAIATHPRMWTQPTTVVQALDQVRAWTDATTCRLLGEVPHHLDLLAGLLERGDVSGMRVHDAHIAAICLGNGVSQLWTVDRDFSRFPELRTTNPLGG